MENPIVSATPILFAQTREDPTVEINAINMTNSTEKISICLISSAGDTLCSILASELKISITKIDVIDISFDQLCLAKLKFAILRAYNGKFNTKILCQGFTNNNINLLNDLYNHGLLDFETYMYWLKNIKILDAGVNQMGRFELVFKNLKTDSVENVFSYKNLTEIFGENATKYSMCKSFAEHFSEVLSTYKKIYPSPSMNYFYNQVVNNCYPENGDIPIYLSTTKPVSTKFPVNFYKNSMLEHLKNQPNESYNIIHLSNVTDWLDPLKFLELLDEVGRVLVPDGKAILRRLNSDVKISTYISNYYSLNGKYKFGIVENISDKSHFYLEVLIIVKKIDK